MEKRLGRERSLRALGHGKEFGFYSKRGGKPMEAFQH